MRRSVRLLSPPGYGPVVPLDRQRHARHGLGADRRHGWAAGLNAVPIGAAEFFQVARDYPIAFVREPRSGEFLPMAVLGLRERENLFVDANGHWQPGRYIPAYVRRFPFCVVSLPDRADTPGGTLVCVQEDQLTLETGAPLLDAQGEPTPAWGPLLQFIEAVEEGRQQARVLSRRLEALDLLVPFEAVAMPRAGTPLRLRGLYRIDEPRLAQVPGRDLRTMLKKGELKAAYAHLISLENFGRLLDLAQARRAAGT